MTTYEKERRRSGAGTRTDTASDNGENDTASLNPTPSHSISDTPFFNNKVAGEIGSRMRKTKQREMLFEQTESPAHTPETLSAVRSDCSRLMGSGILMVGS
jgi:hypothetical protein